MRRSVAQQNFYYWVQSDIKNQCTSVEVRVSPISAKAQYSGLPFFKKYNF